MTTVDRLEPAAPPGGVRWWRRPWVAPLMLVTVVFLAAVLPPYLTLDPDQANVPAPAGNGWHYPLLLAHIGFGSVALLTCGFQVWPWFRGSYPDAHRVMGRLYVFLGVFPAGLLAVVIGAVSPFGPVARVANVLSALLWLAVTVAGIRMAVQRRHREHRRWMIRSFALTTSIVAARIWGVIIAVVMFANEEAFDVEDLADPPIQALAGLSAWLGLTVNLIIAEWWLDRRPGSSRRRPVTDARLVE